MVNNYLLKEIMNLPMPHCFTYKIGAYPAYHIGALNILKKLLKCLRLKF